MGTEMEMEVGEMEVGEVEMEMIEMGMIEMGMIEVGMIEVGEVGDGGPLELSFVAVRRKVRGGRQGI